MTTVPSGRPWTTTRRATVTDREVTGSVLQLSGRNPRRGNVRWRRMGGRRSKLARTRPSVGDDVRGTDVRRSAEAEQDLRGSGGSARSSAARCLGGGQFRLRDDLVDDVVAEGEEVSRPRTR